MKAISCDVYFYSNLLNCLAMWITPVDKKDSGGGKLDHLQGDVLKCFDKTHLVKTFVKIILHNSTTECFIVMDYFSEKAVQL